MLWGRVTFATSGTKWWTYAGWTEKRTNWTDVDISSVGRQQAVITLAPGCISVPPSAPVNVQSKVSTPAHNKAAIWQCLTRSRSTCASAIFGHTCKAERLRILPHFVFYSFAYSIRTPRSVVAISDVQRRQLFPLTTISGLKPSRAHFNRLMTASNDSVRCVILRTATRETVKETANKSTTFILYYITIPINWIIHGTQAFFRPTTYLVITYFALLYINIRKKDIAPND